MVGAVNIQNVTRIFKSDSEENADVTALSNLNLSIEPGSFVSLIGPSGCGKSTLLRIISGLDVPNEGCVFVDGKKVIRPGSDIGMAFQQANLFPWMTVRDNLAFGLRARGIYKTHQREIEDFIQFTGLVGFEKSYPHQLSGGMAQRASLARALVGHPKVLLLDEPLGALDAFTRMNMQDEILRIWKKYQMTMIMVTHDVDEAIYLSDKVVVMSPRPAKVERIISVDLSRPRARNQDVFIKYRTEILDILNYGGHVSTPEYNL